MVRHINLTQMEDDFRLRMNITASLNVTRILHSIAEKELHVKIPGSFFVNSTRICTWLVAISVKMRKFSSALNSSFNWILRKKAND